MKHAHASVETASVKWCACGASLAVRVESPDFSREVAKLRDRLMRALVATHAAKCVMAKP